MQYITSKEQLRQLLPTAADVSLEHLQSYFARAEFQLLRPWLGQATLSEIAATPTTPVVAQLLEPLTLAVATFGMRLYAGASQQLLTANGPRRLATADQKPLNPQELVSHLAELEKSAYALLDEAQIFLEDNPATFATWHNSKFCTLLRGHFFRDADQFDRYAQGDVSRLRFRSLWPAFNTVQLRFIRPLLGQQLLERLLEEQELVDHSEVINLIRTAIAGLSVEDDVAYENAHFALDELRYTLNLSLDKYPEFESSLAYEPPVTPTDQSNNFYAGY